MSATNQAPPRRGRLLALAGIVLAVGATWLGLRWNDPVRAMARAVARVAGYHAVLDIRSYDAAGEEWLTRRIEVWYAGGKYALRHPDGTLTANDGQRKWQISEARYEVALLQAAPDPTRRGFDLPAEAARATASPHRVVARETESGRKLARVEVAARDAQPYQLWIDTTTDLPARLETTTPTGRRTVYEFVELTTGASIDPALFTYQPPPWFAIIGDNPSLLVSSVDEAIGLSGLSPALPAQPPTRILAAAGSVILDYDATVVIQTAPAGSFDPAPNAGRGSAAGGPVEILRDRLRWRQAGVEVVVEGPDAVDLARQIAPDLILPQSMAGLAADADVVVPVDMDAARASQQQVDAGHSPWQLDPLQVAMAFVNLQVAPDGIQGEPPIRAGQFRLVIENGLDAVVSVSDAPITQVYLKRLVRQDETGIWSVVGYDLDCFT